MSTFFTKEEVKQATLEYFKGDNLAADVWIKKYCLKDSNGNLLEKTPDDMHHRLAKEFARIEREHENPLEEEKIYEVLKNFRYIVPQGSPMYGIGNETSITSLSNCFVIGSNNDADSYGSIMRVDEEQVQLMKRRGGVGHDLSHLRPGGATTNNTILEGGAGMPLYMERYSASTREVAQGGRRGALMLSTLISHPDSETFMDAKLETGKVTGANISVKITDDFMKAVEEDSDYYLVFPVTERVEASYLEKVKSYDTLYKVVEHPYPIYVKKVKAKRLWDKIIKNAWQSAEPGVLFWDTILRESPANRYGKDWKEVSTNPCGEIPLCPYDSCRLLAINLYSYVKDPFTSRATFDFDLFKQHVTIAQRLMDDIVTLEIEKIDRQLAKIESDPESEDIKRVERELWLKVREKAVEGRRTGLGVTAEGDMLAAMGLKYGSDEATSFAVKVHKALATWSYISSIEMAKERGAFPIWDINSDKNSPFVERVLAVLNEEIEVQQGFENPIMWQYEQTGRRNIANLTIAPTGTTSLMTQTTSGIEPLYLPYYKRRTKVEDKSKATFTDEVGDGWVEYFVVHPKFVDWYKAQLDENVSDFRVWYTGYSYEREDIEQFLSTLSEEYIEMLFRDSPYYQATANDIDWKASVEMQGAIQKWVDHSISKTVNIPKHVTVEEVNQIYRTAYHAGCKGCTIYRDGSRSGVLVSAKEEKANTFEYTKAFKRPKVTECDIYHKTALKKDWTVLVGKVNGNPYEIFVIPQLENSVFPSKIEKGTLTKVKSRTYELKGNLGDKVYNVENIVEYMTEDERVNTRKYSSMLRHGMHPKFIAEQIAEYATVVSFDKVVQRVLKNYIEEVEETPTCPNCGSSAYHAKEGCWECPDCGYAKCD